MTDYLRDKEAAQYLGVSEDRLKRRRLDGTFREGVHYFYPPGMRRRWKIAALVDFIEHREVKDADVVPLARGRRVA